MATVIAAGRVLGGVVAYQMAFTFFLLPYALLANPLTTTLYPRLAAGAAANRIDEVRGDLTWGVRTMAFVLVPAAFVIAAVARPVLEVLRIGNLDVEGAELVALTLSGYMAGLVGYALAYLLTRASYAVGDVRSPTLVSLVATSLGVIALAVGTDVVSGNARVLVLGLAHAAVVTGTAVVLARIVGRRVGAIQVAGAIVRDIIAGALAGVASWIVVDAIGIETRPVAFAAMAVGGVVGVVVYLLVQLLVGSEELRSIWRTRSVQG
jgi:putative peptidoglycan lipid II flippase